MWILKAFRIHRISIGKPDWKLSLGRQIDKREDNIKTDLKEVKCEGWSTLKWLKLGASEVISWTR
jgi:hypothetical protein